jgi:hypothetical protein
MGRRLLRRTLPLGDWQDWQTNLARFSLAVDAGCRFAGGRLDGNVAPCCRSIARYAVVGQAKSSPVHLLARFRTRPREMFRLVAETLGIIESGAAEKNVWRQVWDATLQAS